ncbi:MAG: trypsin-like peptidase domain-containing protein [Pirellulaceae bacterium]|nr:trypsin-like peptidase domain-containing protein [Pirellulaceae bacterium]
MNGRLSKIECVGRLFGWFLAVMPLAAPCQVASADQATASVPDQVLVAQASRIQIMQRAAAATVSVFGLDGGGGGSGVLISPDGFALTNYHVSSACGDHMRCGLSDGRMYDAVIVGVDAVGDLSLIQLLGRDDFPTAPLGDSDRVQVGHWCFSAGNPFGLASNLQPSISLGMISGTGRYQYPAGTILEYADCIQTDAAVNPGNSGGPLFNLAGEIIGINGRCSFEKRGRINVGVGYAISINQIRTFLNLLHSGRLLDHATLGATVSSDDSGRVLVSNILSSSDAYRRGMRYGDEVLRLADREVTSANVFKNILGTLPRELRVPVEIRRAGQNQTLLVRLAGVHSTTQLIEIVRMGLDGGPPRPDKKPHPEKPKRGEPDKHDSDASESHDSAADENEPDSESSSAELAQLAPNRKLVQSMLELRPGFSNYFYNRRLRQQVWSEVQSLGDFSASGIWKISGRLAGESTPVELEIGADGAAIELGSRRSELSGTLSDAIAARKQGGLLVAMRALRELLLLGPEKIGDSVYLGRLPVYQTQSLRLAEQPWHHAIETGWYDVRVRYHWDSGNQAISLIEVYGDEGVDPAEVYLDRYGPVGDSPSHRFPSRIRLQYGAEIALAIEIVQTDIGLKSPADSASTDAEAAQPAEESSP